MYLTADQFATIQRISRRKLGKVEKLCWLIHVLFVCLSNSDFHFILFFISSLVLFTVLLLLFQYHQFILILSTVGCKLLCLCYKLICPLKKRETDRYVKLVSQRKC